MEEGNQRRKHSLNTEKKKQISRHQHQNTINNYQDNRSTWEPSNPITAGTDYSNITKDKNRP